MAYQALAQGLGKRFAPGDTFTLGGKTYGRDELVAAFMRVGVLARESEMAHATWLAALEVERLYIEQQHRLRMQLQQFLQATYGPDGGVALEQFGLAPAKAGKKTVQVKAAAVDKALETRKLRGTLGKKQKKSIKG
jgi:hypothetical protein